MEPIASPSASSSEDQQLVAGTNHNQVATDYTYPAADVHRWLSKPDSAHEKLAFLTFDDGPTATTVEVLKLLKNHRVPATFFVVGHAIDDAPELLRREIAEGHAVATHSYSHNYDLLYPQRVANPDQVAKELKQVKQTIRDVLGPDYDTTAWRYPGGHMSWTGMAAADRVLQAEGMSWIDWNAMTGDAEPLSRRPTTVEQMVTLATEPITAGVKVSVVLAHDSEDKELTLKAMPQIINAYKAAGYRFGVIG